MSKGPIAHGALLVVALLVAWQTWTRDRTEAPARGSVTVWGGAPAHIRAIRLEGERRTVRVERRGEGDGAYLWAAVTRTVPAPRPPAPTADAGPLSAPPEPPAPTTTTREFPVGEAGDKLVERLAPLLALRDLGVFDAAAANDDFGLKAPRDKLIVELATGGPRELQIGGQVYGGGDRYALDTTSGHVYVLPADVVQPLEGAESSLRERKLHAFEPAAVARVTVKGPTAEKTLVRNVPDKGPVTWASAASPAQPDQTLANFMDRVERLAPMEYVTDVKETDLTPVARFEYLGKDGASLGWLQLGKRPRPDGKDTDYYLGSERTRVLAKVAKPAAEKVDQDLAQILTP